MFVSIGFRVRKEEHVQDLKFESLKLEEPTAPKVRRLVHCFASFCTSVRLHKSTSSLNP